MELLWQIVLGLAPSIGVGFLFYKVIKALLEGDRNERLAYAQWQARHDRKDGRHEDRRASTPGSSSSMEGVPEERAE